jgi:hypothetical protein
MVKQKMMEGISTHVRLPLWKRLMLVTALLLSGEALVASASSQAAHANGVTYVMCVAGDGGDGGWATHAIDSGRGGNGGDCFINGAKGGTGGAGTGHESVGGSGGNVIFHP